jgi:hypothetical protein
MGFWLAGCGLLVRLLREWLLLLPLLLQLSYARD